MAATMRLNWALRPPPNASEVQNRALMRVLPLPKVLPGPMGTNTMSRGRLAMETLPVLGSMVTNMMVSVRPVSLRVRESTPSSSIVKRPSLPRRSSRPGIGERVGLGVAASVGLGVAVRRGAVVPVGSRIVVSGAMVRSGAVVASGGSDAAADGPASPDG